MNKHNGKVVRNRGMHEGAADGGTGGGSSLTGHFRMSWESDLHHFTLQQRLFFSCLSFSFACASSCSSSWVRSVTSSWSSKGVEEEEEAEEDDELCLASSSFCKPWLQFGFAGLPGQAEEQLEKEAAAGPTHQVSNKSENYGDRYLSFQELFQRKGPGT